MELGYYAAQGNAEPVRLVLAYFNLPYTEVNPKDPKDATEVAAILAKHPFDFPNFPYFIDGDSYITEPNAIITHLTQKLGRTEFHGQFGPDKVLHQQLIDVIEDIRQSIFKIFWEENHLESYNSKALLTTERLGQLSKFLRQKDFLLGYPTLADFNLFYLVNSIDKLASNLKVTSFVKDFGNLKSHNERIRGLKGVKEYLAGEGVADRPLIPLSSFYSVWWI